MSFNLLNNKSLIIILSGLFLVLLLTSYNYSLAETSEARYAEISREMYLNKDFLHPQLLGIYHYHKPPMTYWITSLSYSIFGVNEFAARFFLQIALICQILLVFSIARLLFREKNTAVYSAITYATMPIILISTRNLTTDAYLTTFVMGAIYSWLLYIRNEKIYGLYSFYILTALAILTKGPVPLIFIIVFILLYRWYFKQAWRFTKHHLWGMFICLVISASWYVAVALTNPKLLDYFIFDQVASRISSRSFNRAKPFWFYIPIVLGLLFPWLLTLAIRNKRIMKEIRLDKNDKMLLLSAITILLIFSIFKTKLILYLLPMFWMPAIFLGHQISKIKGRSLQILANIFLVLSAIILFIPFVSHLTDPENYRTSLTDWLILSVVCLIIVFIRFRFKKKWSLKLVLYSLCFTTTLLTVSQNFLNENPSVSNTIEPVVEKINELNETDKGEGTILIYNYLLSSVPFYTNINAVTLQNGHNTAEREVQFQESEGYKENLLNLRDEKDIERLKDLCSHEKTYMMVRKKNRLSDESSFLETYFDHKIEYPKWILYYN